MIAESVTFSAEWPPLFLTTNSGEARSGRARNENMCRMIDERWVAAAQPLQACQAMMEIAGSPRMIPAAIRGEAAVEQVDADNLAHVEMGREVGGDFGRGKQVKVEPDVAAILEVDFQPIALRVVAEGVRGLGSRNEDAGQAVDRADRDD